MAFSINTLLTRTFMTKPPQTLIQNQDMSVVLKDLESIATELNNAEANASLGLTNGSSYSVEVQSWLSRSGATPSAAYITNLTNLINYYLSTGDWAHILRMYIVCQENRSWWTTSIKNPAYMSTYPAVENGSLTWDGKGITSDGTTGYVDLSFYLASSYSGAITSKNSFDFGCWKITGSNIAGNDMGVVDNSYSPNPAATFLSSRYSDNNMYADCNGDNSLSSLIGPNNPALELQSVKGLAGVVTGYNKGVSVGTNAVTNYNLPTLSMYGCAGNINGTAANFRTDKYGMFFLGDGSLNHLNMQNGFKIFAIANGF